RKGRGRRGAGRSKSRLDIGLAEVVALEQQGLAASLRKRIGEAVADIELGRMVALAVALVGFAGEACLLEVACNDPDAGFLKQCVETFGHLRAEAICLHRCLEEVES